MSDLQPQLAQQHEANLRALYNALTEAAGDPATRSDARELLLPEIDNVWRQIKDIREVEFHGAGIALQAAEDDLHASMSELQDLQKKLAAYAAATETLAKVANALSDAISSAQSLGL